VIPKKVAMHRSYFLKNRVAMHSGVAKFKDEHTMEVSNDHGLADTIKAKHILIATGSRPYQPADIDFNHPRIYDSDSILTMEHTPRTLIIFGAGVIGCEYASIFSGLGMKVDLVNTRERLLTFLDGEISDALSYHLRDRGVLVRNSEEFESIAATDSGVELKLDSGKRIKADALLWCNGRSGNTDRINLPAAGLEANHRGQIEVDKEYRTAKPHIYAAGDVIGWPSLASASCDWLA